MTDREEVPLSLLAAESRAGSAAAAIALLEALGRALGVSAGKLRSRDRLEVLFAAEGAADPTGAALLRQLSAIIPEAAWDRLGSTIDPSPRTDPEWLNVMLGLRVDEWVRTWAPAVPNGASAATGASGPATLVSKE